MRRDTPSVIMIDVVAKSLGDLLPRMVFVGGATTALYIEDEAAQDPRPTEDVDCIIEIASRFEYYELEKKLENRGFRHSFKSGDPICRWRIQNITVDIMPTDPAILGFSNRWYQDGIQNAFEVELPSETMVAIFTLPYFIAAKIEAFHGRGHGDFRLSQDVEDIVTVLDGQLDYQGIHDAPSKVKTFIKNQFATFLQDSRFLESLSGHLENGPVNAARTKRLMTFLKEFTSPRYSP